MPSATESHGLHSRGLPIWRPTKLMNMRDLSKDDDFLSHLLVEKLGTGAVPLLVHKMDSSRKLPKTDSDDLLRIVRRLVTNKGPVHHATRQAVDELLLLPGIRYYIKSYTQQQINAFATHASRYFELYHPSGSIEIAHTSRYSHRTGKSELCILATRNLVPGTVLTELKGSMANLTDEEDRELKRTDRVRRDFSVIHSKQMKKNHLFLGPARFVNHDCENNCELFREGRYITFRVIKPIAIGEEITAHYGDGYFGRKNRHCLCETCEKRGRGGYAPENAAGPSLSTAPSDSDTDSDDTSSDSDEDDGPNKQALNERRTRRGVYATIARKDEESSDSEGEDDTTTRNIPTEGEIELTAEADALSELTSLASSSAPSGGKSVPRAVSTSQRSSSLSVAPSEASGSGPSKASPNVGPGTVRPIVTPVEETSSRAGRSATPSKRVTRSASAAVSIDARDKGKSKARDGNRSSSILSGASKDKGKGKEDVSVKREEQDNRVLRTRPQPSFSSRDPPPPKTAPVGSDGKPLPTCCTCHNVLPVISVDSKIVWGLDINKNKKKNTKVECPRCMRHFAIYMQPWPSRIPLPGSSSISTPREDETPLDSSNSRVTQKALSVIDKKLAAVSTLGKHKPGAEDEDVRPKKRQKRDGTSDSAQTSKNQKEIAPVSTSATAQPEKRKRGRPRIKQEEETTQLPPENGSISTNRRKGNESRDKVVTIPPHVESRRMESDRNGVSVRISTRSRKRVGDIDPSSGEPPNKKTQVDEEDLDVTPMQKVVPRPNSFLGGKLFCKPTPLTYAAKAWANPVLLDDLSSDDEKTPITPEDGLTPPPLDARNEMNRKSAAPFLPYSTRMRGALTLKPSPFAFARRRWASVSPSGGEVEIQDEDDQSSEDYGNDAELPLHCHEVLSVSRSQGRWPSPEPYGYPPNEIELASTPDSPLDRPKAVPNQFPPTSIKEVQDRKVTLMHHVYPGFGASTTGRYSMTKVSFPETPPHFVHAGWDSCSDVSES
ncbi:hypothetical protein AX16_010651 [Volvariella volvacea WC 439]|nr:hypothetical protein AX16_010651 [Volvariella volvacea WC 439]